MVFSLKKVVCVKRVIEIEAYLFNYVYFCFIFTSFDCKKEEEEKKKIYKIDHHLRSVLMLVDFVDPKLRCMVPLVGFDLDSRLGWCCDKEVLGAIPSEIALR